MKFKDVRILYNADIKLDKSLINEIEIYDFGFENGGFERHRHLHDKFRFDLGNSLFREWPQWDLCKLLIEFLINRNFSTPEIREKFIKDLYKIDEFKQKFDWLKGVNNEESDDDD